jgi:hypothetical protein
MVVWGFDIGELLAAVLRYRYLKEPYHKLQHNYHQTVKKQTAAKTIFEYSTLFEDYYFNHKTTRILSDFTTDHTAIFSGSKLSI